MNKKVLMKFLIASLAVGTVNFSPIIFHAENNLQIVSVAHAEIKTYEGVGEYVMSDFETPDTAKERAKQRAQQNAQEQAGVYVSSYTEVHNLAVTKDEITVITSGIMKIKDVVYEKSVDSDGILFRAKIKADIDTDGITNWLNKNEGERSALVSKNQELQNALAEQDRKIAELKRQLEDKNSNTNTETLKKTFTEVDNEFLSNQKIESGNNLYFQGDYYGAISNYTQAIELNPKNIIAYRDRGTSFANLKEYKRAADDFSSVIAMKPDDVAAYVGRGAAYICLKNFQSAISDLTKAIQLNPNDSMAYYNRGICYQALDDMNKAQTDFNKARQLGFSKN